MSFCRCLDSLHVVVSFAFLHLRKSGPSVVEPLALKTAGIVDEVVFECLLLLDPTVGALSVPTTELPLGAGEGDLGVGKVLISISVSSSTNVLNKSSFLLALLSDEAPTVGAVELLDDDGKFGSVGTVCGPGLRMCFEMFFRHEIR